MAYIGITLDHPLQDGEDIKFKAPCDCTAVSGLQITYQTGIEGETETKQFSFADSHGNDLSGLGNLFMAGAYVKVMVDTGNGKAYLQNADTNAYLESKTKMASGILAKGSWSSNKQTINIAGVTADNTVIVSAAPASHTIYGESGVYCSAQAAGKLTFTCTDVPSVALTVNVVILS